MKRITYPDGQISALLETEDALNPFPCIKERINSYKDLLYVRSLAEAMHHNNIVPTIFIPCLFGQRSDRRFTQYQSFDLKIIAEILNACAASRVDILDPHSEISLALINRSRKIDPWPYVRDAISLMNSPNVVLVSPDAGAYKKVFDFGSAIYLPVVAAVKHRSGAIIHLQVMGDVKGKDCLIVDDLADGGYTFVILVRKLKELGAANVSLYVTHGFFLKGFEEMKKYVDRIYCTNSAKDITDPYVTQFKVI